MMRVMRELRLVPLLVFATACLFALKIGGLLTSGGYVLTSTHQARANDLDQHPAASQRSATELFGIPDITGSVEKPNGDATEAGKNGEAKPAASATAAPPKTDAAQAPRDITRLPSAAERAVLERLQERRHEIEQRARELDVREGLLGAAEKRLEAKMIELKEIEARIAAATVKKDEEGTVRLKSLVTMYENMKAKDAGRIFDRLDMRVLIEVAAQINPRRMSDI